VRHQPNTQNNQLRQIIETIGFYRGLLLDSVEHEMGGDPKWGYLRSRMLKILGDRGLEGRVQEILTQGGTHE